MCSLMLHNTICMDSNNDSQPGKANVKGITCLYNITESKNELISMDLSSKRTEQRSRLNFLSVTIAVPGIFHLK